MRPGEGVAFRGIRKLEPEQLRLTPTMLHFVFVLLVVGFEENSPLVASEMIGLKSHLF